MAGIGVAHTALPDIGWAWDPADDGDGHLVATTASPRLSKRSASGPDFRQHHRTANDVCVTDIITNPPLGPMRRGELAVAFIEHALRLPVRRVRNAAPDRLRFRNLPAAPVPTLPRVCRQTRPTKPDQMDSWFDRITIDKSLLGALGIKPTKTPPPSVMSETGSTAMKVVGVDPGIAGGLAIVEIIDDAAPVVVSAIDVPIVGSGAKERVDVLAIRDWIELHRPAFACIERAQAMPEQGASSGFKYGRAVGALEATVALCGVPVQIVEPSLWKCALRLPGKRQGSCASAGARAISRCAWAAGEEERPRSCRGDVDRTLWNSEFPSHGGAARCADRFKQIHPTRREIDMSKELAKRFGDDNYDDGFAQSSLSEQTMRSSYLRWTEQAHWTDGDGLPPPSPMLVHGISEWVRRWRTIDGVKRPQDITTKPLPDPEELNRATPQSEWERQLDGSVSAGWKHEVAVYLVNLGTGERYTFSNSTAGAHIAWDLLREAVITMRALRGDKCFPLVDLTERPMKSKYRPGGMGMRPHFDIAGWKTPGHGADDTALAKPATPQLAGPATATTPTPSTPTPTTPPPAMPAQPRQPKPPVQLSEYTLAVMGE